MSTEAGAFLNPILPEFLSRLDPQFVDIYNNNQGISGYMMMHLSRLTSDSPKTAGRPGAIHDKDAVQEVLIKNRSA